MVNMGWQDTSSFGVILVNVFYFDAKGCHVLAFD